MSDFERGKNPKEAMNIGLASYIPRETFVELFVETLGDYLYDYVDYHDFSLGMKEFSKERKKAMACVLYDGLMDEINNKTTKK